MIQSNEYWFSFRNACVSVSETIPMGKTNPSNYTLFFLHGRFGQAEIWESLIQGLSHQFPCMTVDLPGFGKSFLAEDRFFSFIEHSHLIIQLLNHFSRPQQKVILIGHDVGGAIAQLCALKQPGKVAALVLLNSALVARALTSIRIGVNGWLIKRKVRKLVEYSEKLTPEMRKVLTASWECSGNRKGFLGSFRALQDSWPEHYERLHWKGALQNLVQPVLLLWGGSDPINPPEVGAEMVQKFPDAYYFIHEQAGHWPHLEEPQWVLTKMREFIFRVDFGINALSAQKSLLR